MKRCYDEFVFGFNEKMHKDNPYYNNKPKFEDLLTDFPHLKRYAFDSIDGSHGYKFNEKGATKFVVFVYSEV